MNVQARNQVVDVHGTQHVSPRDFQGLKRPLGENLVSFLAL